MSLWVVLLAVKACNCGGDNDKMNFSCVMSNDFIFVITTHRNSLKYTESSTSHFASNEFFLAHPQWGIDSYVTLAS